MLDALHGTPVPRALVRLNGRAVLTDAQGRFSFAQFTDPQAVVSVMKPGYASAEGADGPAMMKVADLDAALALKVYPDAIITGTVAARDGTSLAGIAVQLYRANYDANGIAAAQAGFTVTDSGGNYRFQEPAGKYRLLSRYGTLAESGQTALATAYPGGSSSLGSGYFGLRSGEERRINLRPAVGTAVPVELKVDGMDDDDRRARLRVSVEQEGGVPFSTQAQPETTAGLYRLALPAGSYTVEVTAGSREEPLEGTARMTVSARGNNEAVVHVAEPATYPVEVALDPSAAASTAQSASLQIPTPAQLNLQLHSLSSNADGVRDIRMQSAGGVYAFRVPAGRYRLVCSGAGAWTISSASFGTANLAGGEMNVAGGSGGTPIRLAVTNATGQIAATVAAGDAAAAWVYFVAREPSLPAFYVDRVGAGSTLNRNLPPGSYLVLATETRLQVDLYDRAAVDALAAKGRDVTVAAGGKITIDLPLLPNAGGGE